MNGNLSTNENNRRKVRKPVHILEIYGAHLLFAAQEFQIPDIHVPEINILQFVA